MASFNGCPLPNPTNPIVFFDVAINGSLAGRMTIELFADKLPKTCENFRQLCTGELNNKLKKALQEQLKNQATTPPTTVDDEEEDIMLENLLPIVFSYKGTPFHVVEAGKKCIGGDIEFGDGAGGRSVYNNEGLFNFSELASASLSSTAAAARANPSSPLSAHAAAPPSRFAYPHSNASPHSSSGFPVSEGCFEDENFSVKHFGPGALFMVPKGTGLQTSDSNGGTSATVLSSSSSPSLTTTNVRNNSQFGIAFEKMPWLDDKQVVFGVVKGGLDVLAKLEAAAKLHEDNVTRGLANKVPTFAFIENCGQLQ